MCQFLLTATTAIQHQYVTIGFFQQDDLEKHFGHFRMSAGCNYYITAQDVAHTHAMDRGRLMLEDKAEIDYSNSHHACDLCEMGLTDAEIIILDNIPSAASSLSVDERMALFYIGGYIASKHKELQGDPTSVPQEIRNFINELDRGGLSYPCYALFQFILYSYVFFTSTKVSCCRKRLVSIFSDFPALFHLDIDLCNVSIIRTVNILMKRFCCQVQNDTMERQRRKVAKLSSQ